MYNLALFCYDTPAMLQLYPLALACPLNNAISSPKGEFSHAGLVCTVLDGWIKQALSSVLATKFPTAQSRKGWDWLRSGDVSV